MKNCFASPVFTMEKHFSTIWQKWHTLSLLIQRDLSGQVSGTVELSSESICTAVDIWTAADKCKFEGRKHWNHLTDSSTGAQYQSQWCTCTRPSACGVWHVHRRNSLQYIITWRYDVKKRLWRVWEMIIVEIPMSELPRQKAWLGLYEGRSKSLRLDILH